MREIGTLRQLLTQHFLIEERDAVFRYLLLHKSSDSENATFETVRDAYNPVINELLAKSKTGPYEYPIHVENKRDPMYGNPFIDVDEFYLNVSLVNLNAVNPPDGLKPWGCENEEDEAPEGYYNFNSNKYNKYFAFGFVSWSKIIDTPILVEDDVELENYEILAKILWEMTFYGWTEKQSDDKMNEIMKSCEKAKREIKDGKCTVLDKGPDGRFDIIIPDSIKEQFKKLEELDESDSSDVE